MVDFTRLGASADEDTLWNNFLQAWPIERLHSMTLQEYTKVGSQDTFTRWIEKHLEDLGSVWGGSSFKFGIFHRANKEQKESGEGATYNDEYGWYSKYGADPETAFLKIRSLLVQVAEAAQRRDFAAIDSIDLGLAYKWKVAFHYQDSTLPGVMAIFKPEPLARFLDLKPSGQPMSQLYRLALEKKPEGKLLMEFGGEIYTAWLESNLRIWKVSHGDQPFTTNERAALLKQRIITVHRETGKGQGEAFDSKARVGDLFFLCHGNSTQLLGRITSDAFEYLDKGNGWLARHYEILRFAKKNDPVENDASNWSPRGNSTFWQVGATAMGAFRRVLLKPYFDMSFEELTLLNEIASSGPPLEVQLTQGAIRNGYVHFPIVSSIFPAESYGDRSGANKGKAIRLLDEYGKTYEDDVRRDGNVGRLRSRFNAYFGRMYARPGDMVRISGDMEKGYLMRLVPATEGTVGVVMNTIEDGDEDVTSEQAVRFPLNTIFFGPPGTGKTFVTAERAVAICDNGRVPASRDELMKRYNELCENGRIAFVTFHQSFGYEDFIEGIRPRVQGGQITYEVKDGVLKRLAKVATENWRLSSLGTAHPDDDERLFEEAFSRLEEDIQEAGAEKLKAKLYRGAEIELSLSPNGKSVVVETPGYKLPYTLPKSQLRKLWARRDEIKTPSDTRLYNSSFFWAVLQYLRQQSVPVRRNEVSVQEDLNPYVLIVDEINRGNIAKIFGELITLVEDDKRLGEQNAMRVVLPCSQEEEEAFGLPPNLYIIGTMNTADRSIALLDTALRRRFYFEEMMPKPELLADRNVGSVALDRLLAELNRRIEAMYDRDHMIGHAYFMNVKSVDELEVVFRHKVLPLLQEYFYEDWSKIRRVLNDTASKQGGFVEVELSATSSGSEEDEYAEEVKLYRVKKEPFALEAYRRIYGE